jgi:hypothetical protein
MFSYGILFLSDVLLSLSVFVLFCSVACWLVIAGYGYAYAKFMVLGLLIKRG